MDERLRKALENGNYQWRTIKGLSTETGLSQESILDALQLSSDQIVKKFLMTTAGEQPVFTTRNHFQQQAGVYEKILGLLKNRIA